MWFAENKSWSQFRRSLGSFSAIVCKQGNDVWAEDASGKTIASGEAGVDDASVIQSAIDNLLERGRIFLKRGVYLISSPISLRRGVILEGEGYFPSVSSEGYSTTVLKQAENTDILHLSEVSYCQVKNLALLGDRNYIGNGIVSSRCGNNWYENLRITNFKGHAIKMVREWDSYLVNVHAHYCGDTNKEVFLILSENSTDHTDGVTFISCGGDNNYWNVARFQGFRICLYNFDFELSSNDYEGIRFECHRSKYFGGQISGGTGTSNYQLVIIGGGNKFFGIQFHSKPNAVKVCSGTVTYNDGTSESFIPYGTAVKGCEFYNQSNYAIFMDTRSTQIIGNMFDAISGVAIRDYANNNIIIGNEFKDLSGTGISVEGADSIIFNNSFYSSTGTPISISDYASGYIIKHNKGYATENSGTATFSGNGTTTQFSIAHGLVKAPSKVLVTPMTADAASDFYVTADDTNIYINYKSAPPSGTDNLKFSWYAEV